MKGAKLLTSIATLALVISLGACSETEEDNTPGEGEESSNSSESGTPVGPGTDSEENSEPNSGNTSSSDSDLGSGGHEGDATTPQELVEKAYYEGNYSVEIEYDYYQSYDTISYEDYVAGYNGDEEALEKLYAIEENVYLDTSVVIDIYYDVDYILVYEYLVEGESYSLILTTVVVNDGGVWEYYSEGGYTWYYSEPSYFEQYDIYTWEDGFGSLFYTYENGYLSHLKYNSSYGAYDFDDWSFVYLPSYGYAGYCSDASANWFIDLGGDWLFGSYAYSYAYYYDQHYYTYFSEEYQQLMSIFYYPYLSYADDDGDSLYYGEEDIYMYVYDVGETDESSTVYYYHNIFQSQM